MAKKHSALLMRTYVILVFCFMYLPIAVMIAFSFNESKSRSNFTGFTLGWYKSLFHNEMILSALGLSLVLALVSSVIATVLTAIDLKQYRVFSMICYIGMGWAIIPFAKVVLEVLTPSGFWLLLLGGIAYTIGAVLYGIGSKKKWMHSVFHIFVDIGSLLHFLCVLLYAV